MVSNGVLIPRAAGRLALAACRLSVVAAALRRPPCRRTSEGASVDRFEGHGRRVAPPELVKRFSGFLAGVRRGVATFVPAVVVCQRARRQGDAGAARFPPLYRRGIRWRESTCATLYLLCLHKRSIIATLQAWDFFAGGLLASPRVRFFRPPKATELFGYCQTQTRAHWLGIHRATMPQC